MGRAGGVTRRSYRVVLEPERPIASSEGLTGWPMGLCPEGLMLWDGPELPPLLAALSGVRGFAALAVPWVLARSRSVSPGAVVLFLSRSVGGVVRSPCSVPLPSPVELLPCPAPGLDPSLVPPIPLPALPPWADTSAGASATKPLVASAIHSLFDFRIRSSFRVEG